MATYRRRGLRVFKDDEWRDVFVRRAAPEPGPGPLPPGPADQIAGALSLPYQDYNLDFALDTYLWNNMLYNSLAAWFAASGATYTRPTNIEVIGSDGRPHTVAGGSGAGAIAINHRSNGTEWVRSGMVDDGTGRLTLTGWGNVGTVGPRDFSFAVSAREAGPNTTLEWDNTYMSPLIFNGVLPLLTNAQALNIIVETATGLYSRPANSRFTVNLSSPFKVVATNRSMMPSSGSLSYWTINGGPSLGRAVMTFPSMGDDGRPNMIAAFNGEVRAIARNLVYMTDTQLQQASEL